ncbi:MAG: 6,7-dimethyl-8-ribityllumazine synthase [Actinomycetales bacterium]|nr:6,7-dimethyl-8-ribityllumazine synthase [Actinomycetales bacterium]
MSGTGRPAALPDGTGLRIALVTASWHADLCESLRERALAGLSACGAAVATDVRVPGALELPVVAQALAQRARTHAVIALGVVVRGGTPHFDYVCATTSDALAAVALRTGTPVANGVLTCDTLDQAVQRAGGRGAAEDKGWDAALAAVATARTLRGIRGAR